MSGAAREGPLEGPLVALVTDSRDARCRELLAEARRQAAESVARAHREARKRMRAAVAGERTAMHLAEQAGMARRDTLLRQRRMAAGAAALARGRVLLREALLARWQDPAGRRAWIAGLVAQGRRQLPGHAWLVIHPSGWDPAELLPFQEAILAVCVAPPRFQEDPELPAGLRIRLEKTQLDGGIDGMTADGEAMDALLLAQLLTEGRP